MAGDGWSSLFASAFHQSRNAMLLVDGERRIVDANTAFVELLGRSRGTLVGHHLYRFVAGGPLVTPGEWRDALAQGRFTGTAPMLHADVSEVGVQWAAVTEMATGRPARALRGPQHVALGRTLPTGGGGPPPRR